MPDYKVYNPQCADSPTPETSIKDLSETVQVYIRSRLAGLFEPPADVVGVMEGTIGDLAAYLPMEDVLDRWALEESFDVDRVVVEEAAWIIRNEKSDQAMFEVHLTEDESSPNGHAWYYSLHEYDTTNGPEKAVWREVDGGMCWGYQNATELVADRPKSNLVEGRVDGMARVASWEERIGYEYLDEVGVYEDDPALCRRFEGLEKEIGESLSLLEDREAMLRYMESRLELQLTPKASEELRAQIEAEPSASEMQDAYTSQEFAENNRSWQEAQLMRIEKALEIVNKRIESCNEYGATGKAKPSAELKGDVSRARAVSQAIRAHETPHSMQANRQF